MHPRGAAIFMFGIMAAPWKCLFSRPLLYGISSVIEGNSRTIENDKVGEGSLPPRTSCFSDLLFYLNAGMKIEPLTDTDWEVVGVATITFRTALFVRGLVVVGLNVTLIVQLPPGAGGRGNGPKVLL